LHTAADVEAVLRSLADQPAAEIVLVGAGCTGMIMLNALYTRGARPTVVEAADHVLADLFHAEAASVLEAWLKQRGLALHCGSPVTEIRATEGKKQVVLANGTTLNADLVLLTLGTRPNLGLARAAGIGTDQGILVNERMQTHIPNIYAAGAVAQGPNLRGGRPEVHPLRAAALEQGEVAGANMAGYDLHYTGSLRAHILECCGLYCASMGRCFDPQERMTSHDPDRPSYRQLFWMGDIFAGALWRGPASDPNFVQEAALGQELMRPPACVSGWKAILRTHPFDIRRAHAAAPAPLPCMVPSIPLQQMEKRHEPA
jgi:NAD(P)H-nitrite reductase large subunit